MLLSGCTTDITRTLGLHGHNSRRLSSGFRMTTDIWPIAIMVSRARLVGCITPKAVAEVDTEHGLAGLPSVCRSGLGSREAMCKANERELS